MENQDSEKNGVEKRPFWAVKAGTRL